MSDPPKGGWFVDSTSPCVIWTDANSMAYGFEVEIGGDTIEDA